MVARTFIQLLVGGVFVGCAKQELDVDEFRSNPFDPMYNGPAMLYIDSVVTVTLITNTVYQQRIHGRLDPMLLQGDVSLVRMIETTERDTFELQPFALENGSFRLNNNQVTLGQVYCFEVDVLIDGNALTSQRWEDCVEAEL